MYNHRYLYNTHRHIDASVQNCNNSEKLLLRYNTFKKPNILELSYIIFGYK